MNGGGRESSCHNLLSIRYFVAVELSTRRVVLLHLVIC